MYDPAPYITSIWPQVWEAGSGGTVTIGGYYFGSNSSVSLSGDSYATLTYSSQSGEDPLTGYETILATYGVGSGDPGGSVTVTVGADSLNGSGFDGPPGGGGGSTSTGATVLPLPNISSVDPTSIYLGQTTTVTIHGSNFGSGCPTFNLPTGVVISGTPTCGGSEITVDLIPQFGSSSIGYGDISLTNAAGTGTPAVVLINGPVEMKVLSDDVDMDSDVRETRYQVIDHEGEPALNSMHLSEAYSTTSWSCTTLSGVSNMTPPGFITNACDDAAATNTYYSGDTPFQAVFRDVWSFESTAYGPTGCGYEGISDYWQWCGNSAGFVVADPTTPISIGHLYGYSHTNAVSIEGVALAVDFSGTSALIGTVITPSSNP